MADPIRALFIATAFPRHDNDPITPWLGETVRRLRGRGIEAEVLAPAWQGAGGEHVVDGVRVHRFRYAPASLERLSHERTVPEQLRREPMLLALVPGYLAAAASAAKKLARTGRYDIVHAFWPVPHAMAGQAAKQAAGLPLVITFLGAELVWSPVLGIPMRMYARRAAQRADAVTTISNHTAALLARVAPDVTPEIVPFGAAIEPPADDAGVPDDSSEAAAQRRAMRREGLQPPLSLLFVGRLVERKGVHVLLDALARMGSQEVTLTIVGDGPERAELVERSRWLGLDTRVKFLGRVPAAQLHECYRECDAFVLPAVRDAQGDTEGLGVVLIEALSYGKPVVASDIGGIPDVIQHGRTGLLVTPNDSLALCGALRRLRDRPDEAAAMAATGREHVRSNFSWTTVLDGLEGIYRRLVKPPGPPAAGAPGAA